MFKNIQRDKRRKRFTNTITTKKLPPDLKKNKKKLKK